MQREGVEGERRVALPLLLFEACNMNYPPPQVGKQHFPNAISTCMGAGLAVQPS